MSSKRIWMFMLLLAVGTSAHAAALVTYDFNNQSYSTYSSISLGVSSETTGIERNSGTTLGISPTSAIGYSPYALQVDSWASSSYNVADSFSFTLTAAPEYNLNLSQISFAARSGGGNQRVLVEYAVGSGTYASLFETGNLGSNFISYPILLNNQEVLANSSVSFRFSGRSSNSRSFYFDNIVVSGDVSAVPAPGAAALLLAGLGLEAWRRRRKNAAGNEQKSAAR